MKLSALVFLTTLATSAFANPTTKPADSLPKLSGRAACYHESDCGFFYGAKCETYCRQWGQDVGVDRMEKCSFLNNKRCCCDKE